MVVPRWPDWLSELWRKATQTCARQQLTSGLREEYNEIIQIVNTVYLRVRNITVTEQGKHSGRMWMGENIQDKERNESVSGSMAVLHTLQVTEGMEGLDQASKELYKHKEVLAIILKGVVREYESYSYPEIMDFIEADSITDSEVVSPGHSDIDNRIVGR